MVVIKSRKICSAFEPHCIEFNKRCGALGPRSCGWLCGTCCNGAVPGDHVWLPKKTPQGAARRSFPSVSDSAACRISSSHLSAHAGSSFVMTCHDSLVMTWLGAGRRPCCKLSARSCRTPAIEDQRGPKGLGLSTKVGATAAALIASMSDDALSTSSATSQTASRQISPGLLRPSRHNPQEMYCSKSRLAPFGANGEISDQNTLLNSIKHD